MAFDYLEPPNKLAIIISGIFVFLGLFFAVTYQPLQTAGIIYFSLSLVSLVIYSLREFQDDLVGVGVQNFALQILYGLGLAAIFIIIKTLVPAFSVGIPAVPLDISGLVRGIIILGFAPIVESILVLGSLLGFIQYIESKGGEVTALQFWIANIIQSLFFAFLHLAAYLSGWYQAPTAAALATSISANSSAFIAAFTFSLAAGWLVTRKSIRSLIPGIVAHLVVNTFAFVSLAVIFPTTTAIILPVMFAGFLIIPKIKEKKSSPNKLNLPEKEICKMYTLNNLNSYEIAKRFNCSVNVIYRILRENKIEMKPYGFFNRGKKSWNSGLTKETDERVRNGSEKLRGRPLSKERRIAISKANSGKISPNKIFFSSEQTKKIIDLYEKEFLSCIKIGRIFGRDADVIRRILNENGVDNTMSNRKKKLFSVGKLKIWNKNKKGLQDAWNKQNLECEKKEIIEFYKKGVSVKEIGKRYGLSHGPIRRILLENNIEIQDDFSKRSKRYLGEKNPFYGKHHTQETKKKIGDNLIKNLKDGRYNLKPNKPETAMINLIQDNNLPFNYVGDGKIWFRGENFAFNPDFLSKNPKHIIEIFGDYWHNLPQSKLRDKERIETYSKYGYKTLVIWEHELKNPEEVANKIREFLS